MITLSEWLNSVDSTLVIGIGGGGDAISAYPTIRYLQNAGKNVCFANVHVSSDPENFSSYRIASIGKSAFILSEQPKNEKKARCIELITQSELGIPAYSCLSNFGVAELANSLRLIVDSRNITGIIAVDGGTDSIASLDTNITSIVNDAISLAALSQLSFPVIPIGIIGCCADLEMDLNQFMEKFSLALKAEAYMGVIDFPIKESKAYEELLGKAKLKFPFFVCEAVFRSFKGQFGRFTNCYNQAITLYPFQLFTYLFDSLYVINEMNPFVKVVQNAHSFQEAQISLAEFLNRARPGRNWKDILNE